MSYFIERLKAKPRYQVWIVGIMLLLMVTEPAWLLLFLPSTYTHYYCSNGTRYRIVYGQSRVPIEAGKVAGKCEAGDSNIKWDVR